MCQVEIRGGVSRSTAQHCEQDKGWKRHHTIFAFRKNVGYSVQPGADEIRHSPKSLLHYLIQLLK